MNIADLDRLSAALATGDWRYPITICVSAGDFMALFIEMLELARHSVGSARESDNVRIDLPITFYGLHGEITIRCPELEPRRKCSGT